MRHKQEIETGAPDLLHLHYVSGPCSTITFHKKGSMLTVGRTLRSSICIKDPSISEKHAKLEWIECSWTLQDLGSSNGTWVNEDALDPEAKPVILKDQDTIHFGDSELKIEVLPLPHESMTAEAFLMAECSRFDAQMKARCIDMAGKLANEWKTIKDGLVEPGLTSRSHPDYESSLDSDPGSES